MDKSLINGITEEDERRADIRVNPAPEDWFEKLMQKQSEADHRCPKCGEFSLMTGDCPRCGMTWTPPMYD